jgi:hypothetical protein
MSIFILNVFTILLLKVPELQPSPLSNEQLTKVSPSVSEPLRVRKMIKTETQLNLFLIIHQSILESPWINKITKNKLIFRLLITISGNLILISLLNFMRLMLQTKRDFLVMIPNAESQFWTKISPEHLDLNLRILELIKARKELTLLLREVKDLTEEFPASSKLNL